MGETSTSYTAQWYVLRDLRRPNARQRAWQDLNMKGFRVYTPMKWIMNKNKDRHELKKTPIIPDLLFVHCDKEKLDQEINRTPTLQYRFVRGGQRIPMTVSEEDMEKFIIATDTPPESSPRYYLPNEVTPGMYGRRIRIIGGPLDMYEGNLLYLRGSQVKRIIIELPGFLTAAVEVNPDYIQLI